MLFIFVLSNTFLIMQIFKRVFLAIPRYAHACLPFHSARYSICSEGLPGRERMERKVLSKRGKRFYSKRGQIIDVLLFSRRTV